MTNSDKPKKFLSLDSVRIYPNRDDNTFNLIASSDEFPGGFLLNIPPGAMETKIREYFQKSGAIEPQQGDDARLPKNAYLSYSEDTPAPVQPYRRNHSHILSDSSALYDPAVGKVITVTSVRGGTGKTTSSILFGSTFASAVDNDDKPLKVVVVDMDVHDSNLHFVLDKESAFEGFDDLDYLEGPDGKTRSVTDMVNSNTSIEDMSDIDFLSYLVYSKSLGIHALFSKNAPRSSPESSPETYRTIVNRLRKHFDIVILDTSGYQQSSLCAEVAFPMADKILLVHPEAQTLEYVKKWLDTVNIFPSLGMPAVDLGKVNIVGLSPFGGDYQGKNSFVNALWGRKNEINSGILDGVNFLGRIPFDSTAVQHALYGGELYSLLSFHPYFGSAYREVALELFVDEIIVRHPQFDSEPEDETPVSTPKGDDFMVGLKTDGKPLSIEFGRKPILVSAREEWDSNILVENMLAFLKAKRSGSEVIAYGLTKEHEGVRKMHDNLEFLSLLRGMVSDVKGGKNLGNKVILMGDFESANRSSGDMLQERVDKAVMSEAYNLLNNELRGKLQLVVFSAQQDASLIAAMPANSFWAHIHFGSKHQTRKMHDFLFQSFGRGVSHLSAEWPAGRAYVKVVGYEGLIQAFEVRRR